ncbi:MAG: single-stranded DNA-binding protein [Evtepia gabavorous]
MLNKIFLQGRLVADPELRHTQNGVAVASFRLAVDRDFKDRETGERKADFINVVAWRQTGEFVSRFLTKGRLAVVEGKLQTRDYTDRDGNRRYATEVVADNVYFGDSRRDGEGGYTPAPRLAGAAATVPLPATTATPSGGGYTAAPAVDQFADLTDDDGELPF